MFSTHAPEPPSRVNLLDRMNSAMRQSFQVDPVPRLRNVSTGEGMDSSSNCASPRLTGMQLGPVPLQQLEWYAGQGFIGWQMCALLSQNWLIDKACTMPAKDAIRNGWEITQNDGGAMTPEQLDEIRTIDKKFKIKEQLLEFMKNGRVFGVRHALFLVDGIDYTAPFNPDGIKPGSFRGITQIDPYWIAPIFDGEDAANPASPNFYNPTWWQVNGKPVHRSHFIIMRNGDEVPDILKPSYIYGGIPIPQKIYERVFCAERTSNEAPLLAQTKRLTSLKVDTATAMQNQEQFTQQMERWSALMNNFGVKVIDHADEIAQFDTSLTGLDETIMTQYQLVAAASNMPATKLLGTTPKGFNSTGEYENASYHEELESMQENDLTPFLDRYYLIITRSELGRKLNLDVVWNPVDVPTEKELAETNKQKAETDAALVNAGAIDGFDVRQRIIKDKSSGYAGIPDIVPEGPGDREHEQELAEEARESAQAEPGGSAEDAELFDPVAGTLGGARLVTHQRYLDPAKVAEKIAAGDYAVNVTPPFEDQGKWYRMIVDGHHSLAAAMQAGQQPMFITSIPREEGCIFNAVTRMATDETPYTS